MVEIRPFKATILNPEMEVKRLICPVYDTIDAENYLKFAKEKNNVIHITTRRKDMDRGDFMRQASVELERFRDSRILIERDIPAFYIYGIMYSLTAEKLEMIPVKDRRSKYFAFGLVCLVKVEELGKGNIAGHENIFEVNSNERYDLMRSTMMNFSPVAAEYSMPNHDMNNIFQEYLGFSRPDFVLNPERPPLVDAVLNGSRHFLWEITDEKMIGKITTLVSGLKLLILDGHHRYTASNMLRERDGIEYSMMMLMEGEDRALLLLPWHRAVKNFNENELSQKIRENFSIDLESDSIDEGFYSRLSKRRSEFDIKIGMYDGKNFSILRADEKVVLELSRKKKEIAGLDLIVLHEWLIDPVILGKPVDDVSFNASPAEAIAKVDSGEYKAAFFLNHFPIKDVERKAFIEKKNFPQKSTLFLPKVAEGIVMRKIS